jgi:hypothetical protein
MNIIFQRKWLNVQLIDITAKTGSQLTNSLIQVFLHFELRSYSTVQNIIASMLNKHGGSDK